MKVLLIIFGLLAYAASPAYAQTAECSDGWTSNSANFQGTCSHHGGVAVWDNEEMKDQANQWCDENPSLCESSHWAGIEGHGNHAEVTDQAARSGQFNSRAAMVRDFLIKERAEAERTDRLMGRNTGVGVREAAPSGQAGVVNRGAAPRSTVQVGADPSPR